MFEILFVIVTFSLYQLLLGIKGIHKPGGWGGVVKGFQDIGPAMFEIHVIVNN